MITTMKKLFLIVSSAALTIVIFDIAYTALFFKNFYKTSHPLGVMFQKEFTDTNCYQLDETVGYKPKWGNCGFLDVEKLKTKSENKNAIETSNAKRILIIGDSNTAWSNFDKILQQKINSQKMNFPTQYQVYKIGISGYNTVQETDLFFNDIVSFSWDYLILQFTMNDFEYFPVIYQNGGKVLLMAADGTTVIPIQNLFRYSSFYKAALITVLNNNSKKVERIENVAKVKNALKKFNDYARSRQIPFLVVIYPIFDKHQWPTERQELITTLNSFDIDYTDLFNIPKVKTNPVKYAITNNGGYDIIHPNKSFDQIVADSIYDFLQERIVENEKIK